MNRVHQRLAGPVFTVEQLQVLAGDLKGRNASGRVLDPDAAQASALAQKERAEVDVRGLVWLGYRSSPPLVRQRGFSRRDMIEEKSHRHLAGVFLKPVIRFTCQSFPVDGLFFKKIFLPDWQE